MRTVLGSVALSVGVFLLLGTLLTARQFPGISKGVMFTSSALAVILAAAGFVLLLGNKSGLPGQRLIVVLSLVAGLAGLLFAVASKSHNFGKYCGIEGRNLTFKLTVRLFGTVLHEETGPAVQQQGAGGTLIGPSQDLETKMVIWELGLDAALIAGGTFLGGLLGVVILNTKRLRVSV